jgi:protein-disulfide isomerase
MSRSELIAFAVLATLHAPIAQAAPKQGATSPRPAKLTAKTVIATVDGAPIPYGEVEPMVDELLKRAEAEYARTVYDLRKGALDALIDRRLVELHAKKAGKTLPQWMQEDFVPSLPEPTEEELKATYERIKDGLGATYEFARGTIRDGLREKEGKKRMAELLKTLRNEHQVKIALELPAEVRVPVEPTGPALGPADAKVTIVEFTDFECPFCSHAATTVEQVLKAYQGKVRLVFRQFPMPSHPAAAKAAEASLCAADQGKFWELATWMFQMQDMLAVPHLKEASKKLGLDAERFATCLDGGEKKRTVYADLLAGEAAGVKGTPVFFVNGIRQEGAIPFEKFKEVIDRELER